MQLDVQSRLTGALQSLEGDQFGNLFIATGGKYSEATQAGRVFDIASQAAVATTAGLATIWTGLAVGNPTGSGVNLSILRFGWGLSAAGSAAGNVGIMIGATSLTASLTPQNRLTGSGASKALATAGQTVATPVLRQIAGSVGTGATNLVNGTGPFCIDIDGSIVLTPGYYAASYTTAATTAALQFYFMWEEIPV